MYTPGIQVVALTITDHDWKILALEHIEPVLIPENHAPRHCLVPYEAP